MDKKNQPDFFTIYNNVEENLPFFWGSGGQTQDKQLPHNIWSQPLPLAHPPLWSTSLPASLTQQKQPESQSHGKQEELNWDSKCSIVQINNLGFVEDNPFHRLDSGSSTYCELDQLSASYGKLMPRYESNENIQQTVTSNFASLGLPVSHSYSAGFTSISGLTAQAQNLVSASVFPQNQNMKIPHFHYLNPITSTNFNTNIPIGIPTQTQIPLTSPVSKLKYTALKATPQEYYSQNTRESAIKNAHASTASNYFPVSSSMRSGIAEINSSYTPGCTMGYNSYTSEIKILETPFSSKVVPITSNNSSKTFVSNSPRSIFRLPANTPTSIASRCFLSPSPQLEPLRSNALNKSKDFGNIILESKVLQYNQPKSQFKPQRQRDALQQPLSERQQKDILPFALPFEQFIKCYDEILSQSLTQINEQLCRQITFVNANMSAISSTSVLAWRKKVERLRAILAQAQTCYTEAFVPVLNFLQQHRPPLINGKASFEKSVWLNSPTFDLTLLGIRPSKDSLVSESYTKKCNKVAETASYFIHNSFEMECIVEQLEFLEQKKMLEYMQARDNLEHLNVLFGSNNNLTTIPCFLNLSVNPVLDLVENILNRLKDSHLQMIGSKYLQLQTAINKQINEHHQNDYRSFSARVKTISLHLNSFERQVLGMNKMENSVSAAITCLENDFDKFILPNMKWLQEEWNNIRVKQIDLLQIERQQNRARAAITLLDDVFKNLIKKHSLVRGRVEEFAALCGNIPKVITSEIDTSKLSCALDEFRQVQKRIDCIQNLAEKDLAQYEPIVHKRLDTLKSLHHILFKKQEKWMIVCEKIKFLQGPSFVYMSQQFDRIKAGIAELHQQKNSWSTHLEKDHTLGIQRIMQNMEQKTRALDKEVKQYNEQNTTVLKKLEAEVYTLLTLWKTESQKQFEQVSTRMLNNETKSNLDEKIKRIKIEVAEINAKLDAKRSVKPTPTQSPVMLKLQALDRKISDLARQAEELLDRVQNLVALSQSSTVYNDFIIFANTQEKSITANNVINSVSEISTSISTKLLKRNEQLRKYEIELEAMQKELLMMKTRSKSATNELEARILKCTKRLVLLTEPAGKGLEGTRLDQVLAHAAKTRINKLTTARRELNLILHFSKHSGNWESPAREQLDKNRETCNDKSNECVNNSNTKYSMSIKMCIRFIKLFTLFSPILIHEAIGTPSNSSINDSTSASNAKADCIAFAYALRQQILSACGASTSVNLTKALVQTMDRYVSTLNRFKLEIYQS